MAWVNIPAGTAGVPVVTRFAFYAVRPYPSGELADDVTVLLHFVPIHLRFSIMNKQLSSLVFSLSVCMVAPAFAVDSGAVLGGAIGGGVGAAVGSEVGGREGAIIGGAVGGGVGAAIATNDNKDEEEKTVIYVERPHQESHSDHAHGHRIPPGHLKHKHKRKHKHSHH